MANAIANINRHGKDPIPTNHRSEKSPVDQIKSIEENNKILPVVSVEPDKPTKTSDHQPCQECGSIEFIRTGTYFACIVCGASQGCS